MSDWPWCFTILVVILMLAYGLTVAHFAVQWLKGDDEDSSPR